MHGLFAVVRFLKIFCNALQNFVQYFGQGGSKCVIMDCWEGEALTDQLEYTAPT